MEAADVELRRWPPPALDPLPREGGCGGKLDARKMRMPWWIQHGPTLPGARNATVVAEPTRRRTPLPYFSRRRDHQLGDLHSSRRSAAEKKGGAPR
jgi:hypothetical protein